MIYGRQHITGCNWAFLRILGTSVTGQHDTLFESTTRHDGGENVGQWSRPAAGLTRGVRPNSPQTSTSVRSAASLMQIIDQRPRSSGRTGMFFCFNSSRLLEWVSQPPMFTVTKRTTASISRRESKEHCPHVFRPYFSLNLGSSLLKSNAPELSER